MQKVNAFGNYKAVFLMPSLKQKII